jgi:uncharacterized metal-binding protein
VSEKVVIVPCSGIGKTYGSITREAAYVVTEELRPESTAIVPLSLLVLGDAAARAAVRDAQAITLDGCKLACATVNVKEAGGTVARDLSVLSTSLKTGLDCFRRHKQLKPQGIAELNAGGLALARVLAAEVVQACDELAAPWRGSSTNPKGLADPFDKLRAGSFDRLPGLVRPGRGRAGSSGLGEGTDHA